MQIVIDISEARFRDIQRIAEVQLERNHFKTAEQIIAKGIPLPKEHGRLIDADETLKTMNSCDKFGYSCHDMFRLTKESEKDYVSYVHYSDMVKAVDNAPTKEEIEQLNKIGEENDYKEKCRQDYELRHAKSKPQKVGDHPQKPKRKKVCESCGKEFYPNSGVQKLCLECRRQKADISKTAREMLNL